MMMTSAANISPRKASRPMAWPRARISRARSSESSIVWPVAWARSHAWTATSKTAMPSAASRGISPHGKVAVPSIAPGTRIAAITRSLAAA